MAAPARGAVGDYLGRPVATVRLLLEGRETMEPALVQVVETRVGRPLTMAEVRESITHLFSLGRFEDVRVDASVAGAGVVLVYQLSPIHPVTKIVFDGNLPAPGVDTGQLRRAVVDRFGASPLLARSTDMSRTIVDALRERGYFHPSVAPHAELAHHPERATLVFTVDPGPRTHIGTVEVLGTPAALHAPLLSDLGLTPGAPYEADALSARIARYIEARRRNGYYEMKVAPSVRLRDNDRVADVTLTVVPGPHVRVVFPGDPLPSDRRADLVPIEREGSVDEDLLEDSSNRIEEFLRQQGYRDASAPHTRKASEGELVVTFAVRRGPLYHVERVEISGNTSIPITDFETGLRLREGQPFSQTRLDADIATIQDIYRRRGFVSARAQAEIDTVTAGAAPSRAAAIVRIGVREGVRTLVGAVRIEGNQSVPDVTLRDQLGLQPGAPYLDAQLRADADALRGVYANLGYQNAAVEATPNFTADRTRADPAFTVREGSQLIVDHVLIVGNVRTNTETIERELQLKSGDPLSQAAVSESRRRLAALGLFRRISLNELRHGEEARRDLLVAVEEAPATTVGFGGGFEVRLRVVREEDAGVATEKVEFAPRASFEIGRRNLFGKNRSVSLFTSLSLHPKDSPFFAGQASTSSGGAFGFPEYRVIGTFREPRLLGTSADAFVTGTIAQQIRSSFNFARRGANAEVARKVTRDVSLSGSYQIQRTQVFDDKTNPSEKRLVDRLFPQVRLSSFSSSAIRDTRDDQVDPARGEYMSVNGQLAARRIGSEVGFIKTFMTAEFFRVAPRTNRLVFAGRAILGLADAFRRAVVGPSTVEVVEDLPASERFFAGGDTTVRGYALDTLATSQTKDKDGFPIGGNGLVIFNAEARIPVWGAVGVVGFFDSGNVFARPTDIDLGMLKGAVGFGVRYKSPVGPIRIDLGFKLQREDIGPGRREGLTALHISLGQAF